MSVAYYDDDHVVSIADIVREVFPVVTSRALKDEVAKAWGQWLLEPMLDEFEDPVEDLSSFIISCCQLTCRYTNEQINQLSKALIDRGWDMAIVPAKLQEYEDSL